MASTVSARWFYQRSACGGSRIDSRDTTTSGGADRLGATSVEQDATLLRLRRSPPGGVRYNGWDANRISHPRNVYLIHHPDGGVKKYSAGRTIRYVNIHDGPRGAIMVDWSEGTTEGGSSGGRAVTGTDSWSACIQGVSVNPSACALRTRLLRSLQ